MRQIADNITDLIGNTPLVELKPIERNSTLYAKVFAKVEFFNPAGSVKDRAAFYMVKDAEENGKLCPGATIIEPTSGNTGVALSMISAIRGYKLILVMPETMSIERRNLARAYGAEIVLTEGKKGMKGAIAKAEELRDSTEGSIILQQFANPANLKAHYETTSKEIWRDTDGEVDVFVAGVGTGGTVCGTGKGLKELKPSVEVVAVEPETSAVLSGNEPGSHKIQGIGAGFVPPIYKEEFVDRILPVGNQEAMETSRILASEQGILVGISSGAAAYAAFTLASDPKYSGKNIVVLLPDTGERYLSTELWNFD